MYQKKEFMSPNIQNLIHKSNTEQGVRSNELTEKRRIENASTPINRRMKNARIFPEACRRVVDGAAVVSVEAAINGRNCFDVCVFSFGFIAISVESTRHDKEKTCF